MSQREPIQRVFIQSAEILQKKISEPNRLPKHSLVYQIIFRNLIGTFLAAQWLRLCASNAGGAGSILGWGTKSPHAAWWGQKKKMMLEIC